MLAATHAVYHMNFVQAIVIGLLQGLTELFPISSLGHTVLVPSWIGGNWATLVSQESQSESPYLAFVVGLHLATAVVLLGFYAKEWVRLIAGFARSLVRRRVVTPEERLAWLIVVASVPVGALGLVFEHQFRVLFAKPLAAALFLTANGGILLLGEWFHRHPRRVASPSATAESSPTDADATHNDSEQQLSSIGLPSAVMIGAAQALALLAGISREGVAMVGGLFRGLNRANALRFSFLLSTPVIFAAGMLKVPDLLGHLGNGIRGQVIAGSLAAATTSLFAVLFLSRYFKTRTLYPFAAYSALFGVASVIRFSIF
ncbi:MAG TPA: undecaprenyl-diphosphate phosphatase [Acidimicrobiales bacterium]|nr:undecaprenyl-diphosphate phosphatase [Acidimicrobiales bacterium]